MMSLIMRDLPHPARQAFLDQCIRVLVVSGGQLFVILDSRAWAVRHIVLGHV